MTKTETRVPQPSRVETPESHLREATRDGFIEFRSSVNSSFTFIGHLINEILLDGEVIYTFTHSAGGVLQTIVNNPQGVSLAFTYNTDGTILAVASDAAP